MKVLNILTRRCVPESKFNETVQFYQDLIGQTTRLAFDYPEYDLKLAQVGSLLFIGGTPESLASFQATQITLLVSDIYNWEKSLSAMGAVILNP